LKASHFNVKIFFVKLIFHLFYYYFMKKPISEILTLFCGYFLINFCKLSDDRRTLFLDKNEQYND